MKYSSSMSLGDGWDLAPGEAISQNSPIVAPHGERTILCPAPTLDTEEFLDHNACSEDCSSVDSMADFSMAPGEIRSQIPFGTFYGSQLLQCPPPTLDTQDFENKSEWKDVWIVEDSLACSDLAQGECRSQGPVFDMPNAPDEWCPPSLDSPEFEYSRVIPDDVWLVEDSLACWDRASVEARSAGPRDLLNNFKPLGFPSSIDSLGCTTDDKGKNAVPLSNCTPVYCTVEACRDVGSKLLVPPSTSAAKRRLSPNSPHRSNGQPHKQVKLDAGAHFPADLMNLLPVTSTERSIWGESHRKVSAFRNDEDMEKQNLEVANLENIGLGPLSSPKHTLQDTGPSTISVLKLAASNLENSPSKIASVTKLAPIDVMNLRVSAARSPTKWNFDMLGCSSAKHVENVTNPAGYLSKNGAISERHDPSHCTEVDAKGLVQKTGIGAQSIAEVQGPVDFEPFLLSLDVESATSQKLGNPNSEGWLCPKDSKKLGLTSKQLSLDRWIS